MLSGLWYSLRRKRSPTRPAPSPLLLVHGECLLFWGRAKEVKKPQSAFFDGKGYRHIASKHGFGPADEQATRNAIHGRPITTEKVKVKKQSFIKRTYEGSRYRQHMTSCRRVVVIDYPPRSKTGGEIIALLGVREGLGGLTP